jgi:tetratricopeptide (TPR) repeat protein
MKKKNVAGILALILGIYGVHRFYLGQRFLGVLYLVGFFIGLMVTIGTDGEFPLVTVPAIIGFIDAVLLFVMPKEDFDERYNKKRIKQGVQQNKPKRFSHQTKEAPHYESPRAHQSLGVKLQTIKKSAIELFRDYEFEDAIEEFLEALELAPNDPSIHFNLACCYSMVENAGEAYKHLEKAVENGFDATKKIQAHTALAYLRTHPEFDQFVESGFKVLKALPTPKENLLDAQPPVIEEEDLLTQISKLGDLLDKGILTQEEFAVQKQKLLEDQ